MNVCIFITHPSQFDVPIFRLGNDFIHVVFTDSTLCAENFDPELKRNVTWGENIFDGYSYEILSKRNRVSSIFKILKNKKFDLVITSGYFNFEYISSILLGFFLSKKSAVRLDTVGYSSIGVRKFFRKFVIFILDLIVDYFFVVGSLSKQYLDNFGIQGNKIKFFGYVTNSTFFSEHSRISDLEKIELYDKYKIPTSRQIVLCVSKHIDREAPFDSIRAFSLLQNSDLHLLLVGDGVLHGELMELARNLNIDNVSFIGYVDYFLLPKYYAIASVFIHDSRDEPWGVSVQEAIACNVPVIASNRVGAGYDLIIDDENGFTYKSGDVVDLSVKIVNSILLDERKIIETNKNLLQYWNYETIILEIKSCDN